MQFLSKSQQKFFCFVSFLNLTVWFLNLVEHRAKNTQAPSSKKQMPNVLRNTRCDTQDEAGTILTGLGLTPVGRKGCREELSAQLLACQLGVPVQECLCQAEVTSLGPLPCLGITCLGNAWLHCWCCGRSPRHCSWRLSTHPLWQNHCERELWVEHICSCYMFLEKTEVERLTQLCVKTLYSNVSRMRCW
jgi:hypothetical protein